MTTELFCLTLAAVLTGVMWLVRSLDLPGSPALRFSLRR